MSEGGCNPDGRFYCGSMAYDQRPGAASLYRLDPDRSVHVVLQVVTVSNGLDLEPDGSRAYYNDGDGAGGRIRLRQQLRGCRSARLREVNGSPLKSCVG